MGFSFKSYKQMKQEFDAFKPTYLAHHVEFSSEQLPDHRRSHFLFVEKMIKELDKLAPKANPINEAEETKRKAEILSGIMLIVSSQVKETSFGKNSLLRRSLISNMGNWGKKDEYPKIKEKDTVADHINKIEPTSVIKPIVLKEMVKKAMNFYDSLTLEKLGNNEVRMRTDHPFSELEFDYDSFVTIGSTMLKNANIQYHVDARLKMEQEREIKNSCENEKKGKWSLNSLFASASHKKEEPNLPVVQQFK